MNLIEFSREEDYLPYYPTHPIFRFKFGMEITKDYESPPQYHAITIIDKKRYYEKSDTLDDAREFCTNVLLDEIDSKEKLYQEIKQILNPKKRYTLEELRLLYLEYESTSKVKYFTEWLEEKEKKE